MKHVVDLENAAKTGDSDDLRGSGVRELNPAATIDPATEEIEIESTEITPLPLTAAVAPPPIARRTSVPPPPPAEALRVRLSFPPKPAPAPARSVAPAPRPSRVPGAPGPGAPEYDTLKTEHDRLAKRMRERDAYLSELEAVFSQRSEALLKAEAELEALRARLSEREERIAELEQQLAAASAASQPVAASDDLTQIRGIGPRFARALSAMGIGSFAAIAAFTPEDVAEVGRKLKVAAGRIERDRWIEQARALADKQ